MDYALTCTWLEKYQVQVTSRTHSWIADEPREEDGDDLGPNPFEQLLGALGSCMTITVYHYAALGQIALEKLWVDVKGWWDDEKALHAKCTVRVRGQFEGKDLGRLQGYAERCKVHGVLAKAMDIQTEVVEV